MTVQSEAKHEAATQRPAQWDASEKMVYYFGPSGTEGRGEAEHAHRTVERQRVERK